MKTILNIKPNIMKNLLLLLLLFTGIVKAQIVNIPDANFKAKLIEANTSNFIAFDSNENSIIIDVNNDGEIQLSETLNVSKLFLDNCNITSITGIETFINIKTIVATNNQINALDISSLVQLEYLNIVNNQIPNLNLNNNINLKEVFCLNNLITTISFTSLPLLQKFNIGGNQLTGTFNFSSFSNITEIYCAGNSLTSINVLGLSQLTSLDCSSNFLTSIDVGGLSNLITFYCNFNSGVSLNMTGLTNLKYFSCNHCNYNELNIPNIPTLLSIDCSFNNLTSINVSSFLNLETLECRFNQLTTIDVSNASQLVFLLCSNNLLTTLFMKNGANETLIIANNPNLQYVCADENEIQNVISIVPSQVIVNTYCTFTPGGNYNTITGNITYDSNNNGCDAIDIAQPNIRININDGTNQGAAFTNNTGNYSFYTQAGSFNLSPSLENPTFFNFSPPTATIPFADNNNNTATQNFCISANGVHNDLEIVIAPITTARPGFDATYKIVYKNIGNQTLSGNITFTYNDSVLDFVSSTLIPDAQTTGLLNWNYSNLLPFENRSFNVVLNVNSPAVNIGDILNYQATITPVIGDENSGDNLFTFNQTVVGSFDPNDITCIEGNVVAPSEIGNYLHYIINFENTGTFQAENIVVKTTVDATDFDINSLQMLNTSHNAYVKITGNIVEFIFENIALETGGHGNVLLKVRSKNNLVTGDIVSKRADIFFDYNAPIDTGMYSTTFQSLNNPSFSIDNSIAIYPNPASDIVNINCNNLIKSVQLYDVQGRILQTQITDNIQTSINILDKSKGIYFLKITTENGAKVEKIIKE